METTKQEIQLFDTAIIGAGPAGLSAAVYLSRYALTSIVIGDLFGGTATKSHEIGNWLGDEKRLLHMQKVMECLLWLLK